MKKGRHEANTKPAAEKKKKSAAKKPKAKKEAPAKKSGAKKAALYVACALVLIIAAGLITGAVVGRSSKIHPNMSLGGIDIGDMSVAEAEAALRDGGWDKLDCGSVAVTLPGGFEFTVTAAEAGLELDCAEAAEAAYAYGHSGNPVKDLIAYFKCIGGSVTAADILAAANAEGVRARVDAALEDYDEQIGKG